MNNNYLINKQLKKNLEIHAQNKKKIENFFSQIPKFYSSFTKNKMSEKKFIEKLNLIVEFSWRQVSVYHFIYFIKLHQIIFQCEWQKKNPNFKNFNTKIKSIWRNFLKKSQDFMLVQQNDYFTKLAFWNNHDTSKQYRKIPISFIEMVKTIFTDEKILNNIFLFLKKFALFFLLDKNVFLKKTFLKLT